MISVIISGKVLKIYVYCITRDSRCLAGEPKHFPLAAVFVFIIKSTLTCARGFPQEVAVRTRTSTAQEYYVQVPLRGGHLSCYYFGISPCTYVLLKKAIFW